MSKMVLYYEKDVVTVSFDSKCKISIFIINVYTNWLYIELAVLKT